MNVDPVHQRACCRFELDRRGSANGYGEAISKTQQPAPNLQISFRRRHLLRRQSIWRKWTTAVVAQPWWLSLAPARWSRDWMPWIRLLARATNWRVRLRGARGGMFFVVHPRVVGSWERGLQAASTWASQRIWRIQPKPGNERHRSAV